jgi:hypothetical protein
MLELRRILKQQAEENRVLQLQVQQLTASTANGPAFRHDNVIASLGEDQAPTKPVPPRTRNAAPVKSKACMVM